MRTHMAFEEDFETDFKMVCKWSRKRFEVEIERDPWEFDGFDETLMKIEENSDGIRWWIWRGLMWHSKGISNEIPRRFVGDLEGIRRSFEADIEEDPREFDENWMEIEENSDGIRWRIWRGIVWIQREFRTGFKKDL